MTPQEFLSAELRDFALRFVRNRQADIRKRGLTNSEDLANRIYAKVNAPAGAATIFMVTIARNYGRLQDMRRRYTKAGGPDMIAAIEDWVKREGIAAFSKDGKRDYQYAYKNQLPERVINRIAWGIVTKYRQRGTAPKRSWWNRGKTADIAQFYAELLRGYAQSVAIQAKKTIEG